MRIDLKDDSPDLKLLMRLQKVFKTATPTDTVRVALQRAYEAVRQEEIVKAAAAQQAHAYDDEMSTLQGLKSE